MRVGMGAFVRSRPGGGILRNPITGGMGDFVPGNFSVPQNPVVYGLSGLAAGCCGSNCGCGPCRTGMGTVDLSIQGTGISTELNSAFGTTAIPAIPNWGYYAVGAFILFGGILGGSRKRRR